jgi:hypothetical protein
MVPNSILEDSTRPTVVVSEQRVRGGQVCDGGRHEVKKSRDIGLDPSVAGKPAPAKPARRVTGLRDLEPSPQPAGLACKAVTQHMTAAFCGSRSTYYCSTLSS